MLYRDLVPIVAIDAMGAPNPLILRKIAEAAHEFYRLTRAWLHEQTQASVAANTKTVALTPPADSYFIETAEVWLGGERLFPPLNLDPGTGWEERTGRPEHYIPQGPAIRLLPFPVQTVSESLRVKFAVAPTVVATQVPDAVALPYQDALIEGAKARLLGMSRKDWTDPMGAGMAERAFRARINEVRVLARNQGTAEAQHRVRSRFL